MTRTVLVTGSSSGIGRATARAYLEEGWTVYATARDTDDVADLAEAGCETAALDVTDREQVEAVVDRIDDEQGRLDCLVNNAGFGQHGPVEDVPTRLVERQFDVNVYGPHRLMRAVLPLMRDREDGTIVNVSSAAGRVSAPGVGVYAGSKFALEAMSDALRNEVAGLGIDVVLVEPGPVATGFEERATSEMDRLDRTPAYEAVYTFYEDGSLLGGDSPIASTPEEVAAVILEAGVSTNPRARYPVGIVGVLAGYGRLLPDRLTDTAYRLLERVF
jgi:NAD(P)-dependent dehydrogenase (short-subunit alcohol dehydrogenase family)